MPRRRDHLRGPGAARMAALHRKERRLLPGEAAMTGRAANPEPWAGADDSGGGLAMVVVFTAARLIGPGAVALLLLDGGGWRLGLAFALHVGITAVVVLTFVQLMDGRGRAIANRDR